MQTPLDQIPMRTLDRPERSAHLRKADDGTLYLSCGIPYESLFDSLVDYLERAVQMRPDLTFLAQRDAAGQWRRLTYTQAWRDTCAVATWLIDRGFGPDGSPVMILSENSIEHALLTLGALRAGATVVPVSPTFSLSSDLSRLGYAIELTEPGLVVALDEKRYGRALAFAGKHADAKGNRRTIDDEQFKLMLASCDAERVAQRRKLIKSETIAKILLTSGSTGQPKGVVNTHGNLASAVQMVRQVSEPLIPERIHTVVDWLPWHHTFGGNSTFNGTIAAVGTLYIDDGRPLPGHFKATLENLREISPTGFSCVPAAYVMLAEALENDAGLRQKFFKNMRWLSYGGALLPQPLWERMQRLAVAELGERLPFGTGWGMTETSATGIGIYWNTNRTGLVGLPQPGVELKLIPMGDRLELRIKGPHILPCYYRAPELNAQAFDEEGFFKTGDAARWVDPDNYIEGLEYAGRLAEDFKLLSGTWVQASIIRRDLVAGLAPLVADAVITGADKDYLGAMVWLTTAETEELRAALKEKLIAFNSKRQGSANVIERILILKERPVPEAGEITDKGSINQRKVLERRVADVATLYAEPMDAKVISRKK